MVRFGNIFIPLAVLIAIESVLSQDVVTIYITGPVEIISCDSAEGRLTNPVVEPPKIQPRPPKQYHVKMGENVTLECEEPSETTWKRRDGNVISTDRRAQDGGNLIIMNLRQYDHAFYECVVSNEILTTAQVLVEGTTPHPPYNISSEVTASSVKLSWQPGYPGGKNWEQVFVMWYRVLGTKTWSQIDIKQQGTAEYTLSELVPDQTYEFQIQGQNELGDGMFSDTYTATTLAEGRPPNPVVEPPKIQQYHGKMDERVVLECEGVRTPTTEFQWRRRDGHVLPRERTVQHGGNLTIIKLRKKDHAFYECLVSNEILTTAQVLVEGTTPHPPYNISSEVTASSAKLSWQPGYPGGTNWEQVFVIWYRRLGTKPWSQIDIKQQGTSEYTVSKLVPDQTYEFQIQGNNELGDGMFSDTYTATTLAKGHPPNPVVEQPKIQQYHVKMGDLVVLECEGVRTTTPDFQWRRRDGHALSRERTFQEYGGNLTIMRLRKYDHAFYECVVSNEIATTAQVLVEGTTPHPSYNVSSSEETASSITLSWQPGYPGGNNWKQVFIIWYRVLGTRSWSDMKQNSTLFTVTNLLPDQTYEFQVQGQNDLGDGMFSDTYLTNTLAVCIPDYWFITEHVCGHCTDAASSLQFTTNSKRAHPLNGAGILDPIFRNTVFTGHNVSYTFDTHNGQPTCRIESPVPTYDCTRPLGGVWNNCELRGMCTAHGPTEVHLFQDTTIKCV